MSEKNLENHNCYLKNSPFNIFCIEKNYLKYIENQNKIKEFLQTQYGKHEVKIKQNWMYLNFYNKMIFQHPNYFNKKEKNFDSNTIYKLITFYLT